MKLHLALAALLATALAVSPAHAERADRDKPINIEADRGTADDAKQIVVFEGRVVLTQGTFVLRADRLTVRQDAEGFQFGTAEGKPATFRQKRDGVDEWIEGEAARIEYDGRAERVELFGGARINRGQDEVRGNYIAYETRTELFRVQGAKDPQGPASREGRVRATIQPKKRAEDEPSAPASPPLDLRPSSGMAAPGKK